METIRYPRIASFKSAESFLEHLHSLGLDLPVDQAVEPAPASPLAQPATWGEHLIGNRFCILPMEGWDGTVDGGPGEKTIRRWLRFGRSGAKLIWGGEATAVSPEGRANPRQLWIHKGNVKDFERLRAVLVDGHRDRFGTTADLLVGLQLTHSGRFSRPHSHERPEPKILYHHPILDKRLGIPPEYPVLGDNEIREIRNQFVEAARLARDAGFAFVDVKHCHGYLGHEFLSAFDRPGPYGGCFENRTRFLREVVEDIQTSIPGLQVAIRFSAFDSVPYRRDINGRGVPESWEGPYPFAFGCDAHNPLRPDLTEAANLVAMLAELGVGLVCVSAGSPYYNPHVQRPALFPPSDGYDPPEDPLAGVARQIQATAELKRTQRGVLFVGSAYSYLQEYLPHVAQAAVRHGWTDFVGLGRVALSYPELPADLLEGRPFRTALLCRTFSDCTTAPRRGLPSGCYPLDEYYRKSPEAAQLQQIKKLRKSNL
jgi:2,4-dienoyl-CoA reductase-like NADH-dependent reductase (Old Yellow Enzyme family)